jgi:hypothetical protein
MFEALYENHFQYDCSMPSRAFGYLNLGTENPFIFLKEKITKIRVRVHSVYAVFV